MTGEREITSAVELCRPDGRLNPAAVGFSRTPLHHANLRGWGRTKRWEYWGVVTPSHIIGVVASSLDYAGVHSLYVLDRATGHETTAEATVPFARDAVFPPVSGTGRVSARGGGLSIDIDQDAAATTVRAHAKNIDLDLTIPHTGHDVLGVVVGWSTTRFQYTLKDVGRPVHGTLGLGGVLHPVPLDGSFAVLDHGRGKWPYSAAWNWAAGYAPGRALQLGGKWTDGTGSTENGLILDGVLHKISEDLVWTYDRRAWRQPWRVQGERVDVRFEPFHERVSRTNLGILAGETHQCFGHFTGWATDSAGHRVDLSGLTGWAEEARNRW
ncbi:DUF2804 domain-containing protein [Actinoplanes sp. NPDC051859]|uniref:DUF2804 domain-containing protein n=1 Tax=Actinoplanes sp. NPDC051859 TaxID=3363909 RepID=UPI003798D4E0